eukprot:scaffold133305_cov71-Phaeocystis_antarctica.AAC.3
MVLTPHGRGSDEGGDEDERHLAAGRAKVVLRLAREDGQDAVHGRPGENIAERVLAGDASEDASQIDAAEDEAPTDAPRLREGQIAHAFAVGAIHGPCPLRREVELQPVQDA